MERVTHVCLGIGHALSGARQRAAIDRKEPKLMSQDGSQGLRTSSNTEATNGLDKKLHGLDSFGLGYQEACRGP